MMKSVILLVILVMIREVVVCCYFFLSWFCVMIFIANVIILSITIIHKDCTFVKYDCHYHLVLQLFFVTLCIPLAIVTLFLIILLFFHTLFLTVLLSFITLFITVLLSFVALFLIVLLSFLTLFLPVLLFSVGCGVAPRVTMAPAPPLETGPPPSHHRPKYLHHNRQLERL